MIEGVLKLWDMGFDTWQIAKTLREDQSRVERALHEGLEKRRREADQLQDTRRR